MLKCIQTGKEIHLSKGKAEAHLKNLSEMRSYGGHVYHCEYCNGWHVGREKKTAHQNKYRKK